MRVMKELASSESHALMKSYKVLKKVEDAKPEDLVTKKLFSSLLELGLRIGYNPETNKGLIDFGFLGDLYFQLSSNDPMIYFSLNDDKFAISFRVDDSLAAETVKILKQAKDHMAGKLA